MTSLGIAKGPLVGRAMELQTRWQIRNSRRRNGDPTALRSECLEFVRINLF